MHELAASLASHEKAAASRVKPIEVRQHEDETMPLYRRAKLLSERHSLETVFEVSALLWRHSSPLGNAVIAFERFVSASSSSAGT